MQFDGAEALTCYPTNLPTGLAAMPALCELELHEVDCLSSAPVRELLAAPQSVFSSLTSLSMSLVTESHSAATALYLWLRWALPAAMQLRKLSVDGGGGCIEGPFFLCCLWRGSGH